MRRTLDAAQPLKHLGDFQVTEKNIIAPNLGQLKIT